jgi:hypothetical protein
MWAFCIPLPHQPVLAATSSQEICQAEGRKHIMVLTKPCITRTDTPAEEKSFCSPKNRAERLSRWILGSPTDVHGKKLALVGSIEFAVVPIADIL